MASGGTAGLQDLRRRDGSAEPSPDAIGLGSRRIAASAVGAAIALKSRGRYSRSYAKCTRTDENAGLTVGVPIICAAGASSKHPRSGATETLSLEDYVLGVTSAEASTEDEIEALEAQAITTRTFAPQESRPPRERRVRLLLADPIASSYKRIDDNAAATPSLEIIRRAVASTAGKVCLRDESGRLVDALLQRGLRRSDGEYPIPLGSAGAGLSRAVCGMTTARRAPSATGSEEIPARV